MIAKTRIPKGVRADGKRICAAVVVADTTPSPLPTTGKDVIGMTDEDCFEPMSVLFVVGNAEHKVYLANESGIFEPQ